MATSRATKTETPTPPWGEVARQAVFATTHWSVVLAAGRADSPAARDCLEKLCQTYWYPLYAYVRRRGHAEADAQDLTQEFFARLLEHNWLIRARHSKGRFRSFLLMAMNRFLAKEWEKVKALKRGGGVLLVPLAAFGNAETRYAAEPATTSAPELAYDQQWAMTLLGEVLRPLRQEYERHGKAALFNALKPCLIGSREAQPYATLAAALGMTEGAVKVAVARLRQRYRGRLKEEVAKTVARPEDVDGELRHLLRVLAQG